MKWAFHIFWISFVISTVFVAPFLKQKSAQTQIGDLTNTVASLSVSNSNLSAENNSLQKTVEEDKTVLKVVAVITGITNGTFAENLEKIPARLDEMQHDLKNTKDRLFANKKQESFRLSDTNRVTVFTGITNHGPVIFFKLKHVPIENGIRGTVQGPAGQYPLLDVGTYENVLWVSFPNLNGLEQVTFFFEYSLNINDTNLIKTVWINNGQIFLNNTHLSLNEPKDE